MKMPKLKDPWLTRELLLRLMLPLLAIVVATGALGAYGAHRLTDAVFDRWLLDAAHSLTGLIHRDQGWTVVDLPPQAERVVLFDEIDRTWFSVTQGDRLLAGVRGLPLQGGHESSYRLGSAYDAVFNDAAVRIARVDIGEGDARITVLMAETLIKRQRASRDLLELLWPMAALVLAAAVSIVVAVARTVLPLSAMAARWNEQAHVSLDPIRTDGVPRELVPFASALNGLLARIKAMLDRERQFAATAAHQLRTPLTGLQLGLERAREAPDAPSMRLVIDELRGTTQRTARIVQQLLTLGRLDPEARGEQTFQQTDLVALTQEVGATHVDQALAKGVDLELVVPSRPVLASVQPELLAEALSNLLDNAIRYTPAGGRVSVEFDSDPPTVRVCDSGPGIPESEREAVFERFVRGTSATGEGSGLGLAIVRDIAALHGAHITLADSPWGGVAASLRFSG